MTIAPTGSPHRLWVMPDGVPEAVVGDGVTLRPAVPDDVDRLHRHVADGAALDGGWLPAEASPTSPLWAAWFVHELGLGWTSLGGRHGGGLVVDEPEQPFVGLVTCLPTGPRVVELTFGVAPAFRGRGLATAAVAAAVDWALAASFERVELEVSATDPAGRRVAEKVGFAIVGRRPGRAATGEPAEIVQLRRRR